MSRRRFLLLMRGSYLGNEAWIVARLGAFRLLRIPVGTRVDPELLPEEVFPIRCQRCKYRLQGLTVPRCPECGLPFDRGQALVSEYVTDWLKATYFHSLIFKRMVYHGLGMTIVTYCVYFCLMITGHSDAAVAVVWTALAAVLLWCVVLHAMSDEFRDMTRKRATVLEVLCISGKGSPEGFAPSVPSQSGPTTSSDSDSARGRPGGDGRAAAKEWSDEPRGN